MCIDLIIQALQQHSFRLEVIMLRQPILQTIQQLSRQTLPLSLRATTQVNQTMHEPVLESCAPATLSYCLQPPKTHIHRHLNHRQDHDRQDRHMRRSKLDEAGLQSVTSNAYREGWMAVASAPDDLLFRGLSRDLQHSCELCRKTSLLT